MWTLFMLWYLFSIIIAFRLIDSKLEYCGSGSSMLVLYTHAFTIIPIYYRWKSIKERERRIQIVGMMDDYQFNANLMDAVDIWSGR